MHFNAAFSTSHIQTERFSFGSFVAGDQHIVLRRYREGDRAAVLDLLDEDPASSAAARRNPFILQADPLDIEAIYRGRGRLWVALCRDVIIGVVGMHVSAGVARLRHLAVARTWSGPRDVVIEHMRRKAAFAALSQCLDGLQPKAACDDTEDAIQPVGAGQPRSASAPPALFEHGRQQSACVYHLTI